MKRSTGRSKATMRKRTIATALALAAGSLGALPGQSLSAGLRWPPPPLVNPITIQLGTGYTHTMLSTTRDYIVKLPPTRKVGGTWLEGGHNIVLVGGEISVPPAATATSAQRTALYIKGATGTVHIEGVLINGKAGGQFDGIDIAAPLATVQLQNDRIIDVRGGMSSWHGDVVQPWGGVRELRVDRLTGSSNYQGLFLDPTAGPIGSVTLSNVNLVATTTPPVDHGGVMLWLNSDSRICTRYPVSLTNVWIRPRPGWSLANAVWPASALAAATCPGLTGTLRTGIPSSGSFVPAGAAGLGYTTP